MVELDENNSLSGIFNEEDFETEDEFAVEEELDSALSAIAGLKETLASTAKSEPTPPLTREGYTRTEMRVPDYSVQSEYVVPRQSVNADVINQLSEDLSTIKSAITSLAKNASSTDFDDLKVGLSRAEDAFIELKNKVEALPLTKEINDNDTFATSVIHQLVKIKKLIGSDNIAEVQLNNELNELYLLEQKATRYVENDNIPYDRKFGAIDDLVQRMKEAYNYDISPLVLKANILLEKIAEKPLTKESLTAMEGYLNRGKEVRLTAEYVKELDTFLTLSEKALLTTAEQARAMLDDIVSRKNAICLKKKSTTEALFAEYIKNCNALQTETDRDSVTFLRMKTNAILKEITKLNIGDAYTFEKIEIQKDFKVLKQPSNKSIYETITELKSIISSGGIVSADDAKTGIASDISYIKEKLDIMQTNVTPVSVPAEGAQTGVAVVAGALTLESIVGQLDRLFDDIKNVVDALEINVLDNLAIINDNVNIIKESVDKSTERIVALEENVGVLHEVKEIVSYRYDEDNSSESSSAVASQLERQNEILSALVENMQNMQSRMDEMSKNLEDVRNENEQLKKAVEKIFDTTENNEASFDSIKNVLNELKDDVVEIEENTSETDDELDSILGRINEAISDKADNKQ